MNETDSLYAAVRDRLAQRPLVLLLDVDGTLAPIAPRPDVAAVPDATRRAIARLKDVPGVHVALVSGRAAREAREMVGVDGVWAIGNHGFERISPDGVSWSDERLHPWRERITAAARRVEPVVHERPGTLLEDKGWTLSVHYRSIGPEAAEPLRKALEPIAAAEGLRMTAGKMVFEIRPPVHVDKGTASIALLDELIGSGPGSALYAGDDRTDEDAFVALRADRRDVVTVRIGRQTSEAPMATAAEFVLADVDAMRAFLERLADDLSPARVA